MGLTRLDLFFFLSQFAVRRARREESACLSTDSGQVVLLDTLRIKPRLPGRRRAVCDESIILRHQLIQPGSAPGRAIRPGCLSCRLWARSPTPKWFLSTTICFLKYGQTGSTLVRWFPPNSLCCIFGRKMGAKPRLLDHKLGDGW